MTDNLDLTICLFFAFGLPVIVTIYYNLKCHSDEKINKLNLKEIDDE